MNKDILEGKWKQIRGEAKNWLGKLTDDDFDRAGGSFDKLVGLLQERYGYSRQQAENEINQRLEAFEAKVQSIDPLSRNR